MLEHSHELVYSFDVNGAPFECGTFAWCSGQHVLH